MLIGGAVGGLVAGALLARVRKRKPLGNISALLPRERARGEICRCAQRHGGVTEEAFFRLYLPLLVAMVTGQAGIGFVASLILFGAMHRYQGWVGVLATTALGAVMTGLYLMTGSLWVVMLVHVLVDLNGLVVTPVLGGVLHKNPPRHGRGPALGWWKGRAVGTPYVASPSVRASPCHLPVPGRDVSQFFSRQPVRKIQPIHARHASRNSAVTPG